MTESTNTYDEVPYESLPIVGSHPMRMAAIGHLMGLRPVPLDNCRVLEVGCSTGGNIIPMAALYPKSTFVGIDYSAVQIERGLPTVAALGLTNLTLKAANVLDIGPDFGEFDYIITHGVYSWVPQIVRDKIMEVCSRNLSPRGLAYISYNTYPGWHMLRSIREMMMYHSNKFDTPQKRVEQARALLDYLSSHTDPQGSAYGMLLKNELERLRKSPDYYLLHEHLETTNEPVYFHQFVEHAAKHQLRYVGDTEFSMMVVRNLSSFVNDTLLKVTSERIEMEQYVDFLRNGTFRRSILTHQSATVQDDIELGRAKEVYVRTTARAVALHPDIATAKAEEFRTPDGIVGFTANPITKAAMLVLADLHPQPVHFEKLLRGAQKKLAKARRPEQADDGDILAADLLGAFSMRLVSLLHTTVPVSGEIGGKPRVCNLTRMQAEQGWFTSPFHERVYTDELSRHLLPLLDGTRDRKTIQREMFEMARQGRFPVMSNNMVVLEENALREAVQRAVDDGLGRLAGLGLFV